MIDIDRIKKTAKNKNLSLQNVAEKAGLGINAIYRWKTQAPTTDSICKVAKVLNVSTDYLLGVSDDPEPSKKNKPTEVDLNNDNTIMTFEGRPIPEEDMELIRRLLRGGRNND